MYAKNPSYFDTPQTTYGIKKLGPTVPYADRHHQLGTLSIDGRLIPAPVHSALSGIQLGQANGNGENGGMSPTVTYVLWGVGGITAGAILYFLYEKYVAK